MHFSKYIYFILLIFSLTGCLRVYTIEHYEILPQDKDYYWKKDHSSISVIPYINTNTKHMVKPGLYQYKNNYIFYIRFLNAQKNRKLLDIKKLNIQLTLNNKPFLNSNQSSKEYLQKTQFKNELYWSYGLISNLNWDEIETILIKVKFTAMLETPNGIIEESIEKEIPFTPVFRTEKTNKLLDNIKSV